MTILEAARDLVTQLDDFEALAESAKQSKAFQTRAGQLASLSPLIARLQATTVSMRSAGIEVANSNSFFSDKLAARVRQVMDRFEAASESILAPEENLEQTFFIPVKESLAKWEESVISTWRQSVMTRLGELPQDLIEVLKSVPQFATEIQKLRENQTAGLRIASTLPFQSENEALHALSEVSKIAVRKTEVLGQLQGIPPSVISFISKCASGQAKLSDLAPDVQAWIGANRLLQAFRVIL